MSGRRCCRARQMMLLAWRAHDTGEMQDLIAYLRDGSQAAYERMVERFRRHLETLR